MSDYPIFSFLPESRTTTPANIRLRSANSGAPLFFVHNRHSMLSFPPVCVAKQKQTSRGTEGGELKKIALNDN